MNESGTSPSARSELLEYEADRRTIDFLKSILEKATSLNLHIDAQANILIGVSVAIFLFSVAQVDEGNGILTILSLSSAFAALTALLAIHPPAFMRKKGQEESLMYNKRIIGFKAADDYRNALEEVVENRRRILEQYAVEIYNTYRFSYRPKRMLFKAARNILLIGVLLSTIFSLMS